jgi:hypothetical protein
MAGRSSCWCRRAELRATSSSALACFGRNKGPWRTGSLATDLSCCDAIVRLLCTARHSLRTIEAPDCPVSQRKQDPPLQTKVGGHPPRDADEIPINVSALSEARFQEEVCTSWVLRRAFDKAVRRKPPVVAADAGLMQIQLKEGAVSRCAEVVQQRTTDASGS